MDVNERRNCVYVCVYINVARVNFGRRFSRQTSRRDSRWLSRSLRFSRTKHEIRKEITNAWYMLYRTCVSLSFSSIVVSLACTVDEFSPRLRSRVRSRRFRISARGANIPYGDSKWLEIGELLLLWRPRRSCEYHQQQILLCSPQWCPQILNG